MLLQETETSSDDLEHMITENVNVQNDVFSANLP